MLTLITIGPSAFCEKARWALDASGAAYVEERHAPPFSRLVVTFRRGRGTVPALFGGPQVLHESTEILEAYGDGLYPAEQREEIRALVADFDERLGLHGRRFAYARVLPHRRMLIRTLCDGAPSWERLAFTVLRPFLIPVLKRILKISPRSAERSKGVVEGALADVEARLADGRPYLMGDRFTAADLVFASYVGPLVLAPGYGSYLPPVGDFPADVRSEFHAFRDRPAGQFALRLYRDHRERSFALHRKV